MAHFAGLVAAGEHPNPVPHADVVTTTIHKTLGGAAQRHDPLPRGARQGRSTRAVFPGQQGGPLMHIIAGKAVAFEIAASEPFRERQRRRVANARAFADELLGERRRRAHRRHRRAPRARRPARAGLDGQAGRGPPATRSASPSTATRSRSTRARRWSPAACASARRRWPPAACSDDDFARGRRDHRHGARRRGLERLAARRPACPGARAGGAVPAVRVLVAAADGRVAAISRSSERDRHIAVLIRQHDLRLASEIVRSNVPINPTDSYVAHVLQ